MLWLHKRFLVIRLRDLLFDLSLTLLAQEIYRDMKVNANANAQVLAYFIH